MRKQGLGKKLLFAAEAEARTRACNVIVLASYSFQAPDFYRKLGYEEAGQVKDCPPGQTHYYFKKYL